MNFKRFVCTALLACGISAPALAQVSPYSVTVDVQRARSPKINLHQANDRTIRVQFQDGGTNLNATGASPKLAYFSSVHATQLVYATTSSVANIATGEIDFLWSDTQLNTNGNFFYEAALDKAGVFTTIKQGKMKITRSPPAAGVSDVIWLSSIDFDRLTESGTISNVTYHGNGVGLTNVTSSGVSASAITEAMLDAKDSAADEDFLTFESDEGDFEWHSLSEVDHGGLGGLGDDDHTGYRLESADHTHEESGMQAGKIDHGASLTGLDHDDHSLYLQNTEIDTEAELESLISKNLITTNELQTSAHLAGFLSNETGTGLAVFGTSPTLITPALGTPASGNLSNCSDLPIAGIASLGANVATFLATPSSANLASAVTGEEGSGALVFATSPTLVTPALGTPSSGTLTSCSGLPVAGLAESTSAHLNTVINDQTGSGVLVFSTDPELTTPDIGTPSDGSLANCDGLPIAGIDGLGANVGTFLATANQANLEAAVSDMGNIIQATEIDTEAELEAIVTDMANIIQATEIDAESELEALVADMGNILQEDEIDASSELLAIMDDESGTGALLFGTSPTIVTPALTRPVKVLTGAGPHTLTAAECKSSFVTNDTASTINLSDAPTTGMWLTILVIADVAVAIDDNDVGAVLIWKDGSSGSTLTCSGSSGESVTLFWDGTKWRAILIEGSWTLS